MEKQNSEKTLEQTIAYSRAEKISTWGCLDYLDKLAPLNKGIKVSRGYQQMREQLSKYDPELVSLIRIERKKNMHWFMTTFTKLARLVSRKGEDLASAYRIISGDLHGVWDLTLGVAQPKPGILDLRGYPDKATMYIWAADMVDLATQLYARVWNEIARSVGAPQVETPRQGEF